MTGESTQRPPRCPGAAELRIGLALTECAGRISGSGAVAANGGTITTERTNRSVGLAWAVVAAVALIGLLIGGLVACFFGYRLFRIVLAFTGFVLGALLASSVFGVSDTWAMLIAAGIGGLVGAGVMMAAYFVGVALTGAALGAVAANLLFAATGQGPH